MLPLLNKHELDAILPPLAATTSASTLAHPAANPALATAEAKVRAKREKLLSQIRHNKPGGNEERKLITKWNVFVPSRNAARFPPPSATAIPILLLVHDRTLYLEPALRLYSRVNGINETSLVVSHHGEPPCV